MTIDRTYTPHQLLSVPEHMSTISTPHSTQQPLSVQPQYAAPPPPPQQKRSNTFLAPLRAFTDEHFTHYDEHTSAVAGAGTTQQPTFSSVSYLLDNYQQQQLQGGMQMQPTQVFLTPTFRAPYALLQIIQFAPRDDSQISYNYFYTVQDTPNDYYQPQHDASNTTSLMNL